MPSEATSVQKKARVEQHCQHEHLQEEIAKIAWALQTLKKQEEILIIRERMLKSMRDTSGRGCVQSRLVPTQPLHPPPPAPPKRPRQPAHPPPGVAGYRA